MKRKVVIETNIDCDDIEAYLNGNPDMVDGEYVKVLKSERNLIVEFDDGTIQEHYVESDEEEELLIQSLEQERVIVDVRYG